MHLHLRLNRLLLLPRVMLLVGVNTAHVEKQHENQSHNQVPTSSRWPYEVFLRVVIFHLCSSVEFLKALDRAEVGCVRSADSSEHIVTGQVALVYLTVDRDTGMDRNTVSLRKQLVVEEKRVVRLVIPRRLKLILDTRVNFPKINTKVLNLSLNAFFDFRCRNLNFQSFVEHASLEASSARVVQIVEEGQQVRLPVPNDLVETATILHLEQERFIRNVVGCVDLFFGRNKAVESVAYTLLLTDFVDTVRTLERHDVRSERDEVLHQVLIVIQLLQHLRGQIESGSVPETHLDTL